MLNKFRSGSILLGLSLLALLLLGINVYAFQEEQKKKEEKKQEVLTEEIVVEAQAPRDLPISTTYSIKREQIEALTPRDLSDVLSYATGTFVSTGSKNEFRLKIRGFEGQRIALLFDGIPVYEPYFNSFDLKTLPAEMVESVKVVKGASSVLYGPNAMGGVVNIITKRPDPPSFSLRALYDLNQGLSLSGSGALRWKDILFIGFADYDRSDGFKWNRDGDNVAMANSDYSRRNLMGKIYFFPAQKHEVLLEVAHYSSEFGIPAAREYYRARHWRFTKWDRTQVNLGGTFSLFKRSSLKVRGYYVRHDNVLDAFFDEGQSELQWESTYANASYGIILLGTVPYLSSDEFKFSLNFRNDRVRIQDDVGEEWAEYTHQTLSVGVENHLQITEAWRLVGGLSLDFLKKYTGEDKVSLNPIIGLKFNPTEHIDLHLTLSQKSRFPPMKSLYSAMTGNPDLRDERATNYEFGLSYSEDIHLSGAVFYNRIKDLIQAIRLPDGYYTNLNIGRARIFGFEIGFQKDLSWMDVSLNYTYLDGQDLDNNRPLDLLPESQFNLAFNFNLPGQVKFSIWGLAVSSCDILIFDEAVTNPGYFVLNVMMSKVFTGFTLFIKAENLLNSYYTTEPGYPMKARTITFGFRYNLSKGE